MTDTWEMMGRLLTDEEFRMTVFRVAPTRRPKVNQATRAIFKKEDYDNLLEAVRHFMPDRPISLMGLGEMLWPLTKASFRQHVVQAARIIDETGIDTKRPDYYFYVALGAMTVDRQLRDKLVSLPPFSNFDLYGYKKLSRRDRAALVALFLWTNPNQGVVTATPVVQACETMCDDDWTDDCFQRTIFLKYPKGPHTHPVPLMGPPPVPGPRANDARSRGPK